MYNNFCGDHLTDHVHFGNLGGFAKNIDIFTNNLAGKCVDYLEGMELPLFSVKGETST